MRAAARLLPTTRNQGVRLIPTESPIDTALSNKPWRRAARHPVVRSEGSGWAFLLQEDCNGLLYPAFNRRVGGTCPRRRYRRISRLRERRGVTPGGYGRRGAAPAHGSGRRLRTWGRRVARLRESRPALLPRRAAR